MNLKKIKNKHINLNFLFFKNNLLLKTKFLFIKIVSVLNLKLFSAEG